MVRGGAAAVLLGAVLAAQEPIVATVEAPRTAGVVGESLPFVLVVDYSAAFVRDHALPIVQRAVDVPFVVEVPWLAGGGEVVVDEVAGVRVATGGRERTWRRHEPDAVAGRIRLELPCRVALRAAGELALAPVVVRYAYATAFEDDFLRGRQPVDHQEATATAALPTFVAREVPTADAPAGFTGAVGTFAARAFAEPQRLEVGDECTLVLAVRGNGDLDAFRAPPWPSLPGFVVQGLIERRVGDERQFRFDAVALAASPPVPRLRFVSFDPATGQFAVQESEVQGLVVAPRSPGRVLTPRAEKLLAAQAGAGDGIGAWWWGIGLGILVPVALVVALRRRVRPQVRAQR